jgi:hypothetical protein
MATRATPGSMTPLTRPALQKPFASIGAAAFADSMLARAHEAHPRCRIYDCRRSLKPTTSIRLLPLEGSPYTTCYAAASVLAFGSTLLALSTSATAFSNEPMSTAAASDREKAFEPEIFQCSKASFTWAQSAAAP